LQAGVGKIMRKVKHILIVLAIVSPLWLLADGKNPPPPQSGKSGNFSKKSFSQNSNFSKNGEVITPPNTSGAGSGNAAPISGGLLILITGSALYLTKRIYDDYKTNHQV